MIVFFPYKKRIRSISLCDTGTGFAVIFYLRNKKKCDRSEMLRSLCQVTTSAAYCQTFIPTLAALCVFGSGSAHPTARRPGTVPSGSALLSPPQSHPRGSGRFCLAARLFPPSRREGMAARQSRPLACAAPSCPPHPSVARRGSVRFGAVSPAAQPLAPGPAGA